MIESKNYFTQIKGTEEELLAELESILKTIDESLSKTLGKKLARKLIDKVVERSRMSDEEKRKRTT